MNAVDAERTESCRRCGEAIVLVEEGTGQYRGWAHSPVGYAVGQDHTAVPSRSADLRCPQRWHHFSGSWCKACGGWG